MPPKTTHTPEQARALRELRDLAHGARTGTEILTQEDYQALVEDRKERARSGGRLGIVARIRAKSEGRS